GVSSQCCTNVVTAIGQVTRQLTVIATALSNPPTPPPPIDLTPVVTALGELVTAVGAIGSGPPIDLAPLVNAVDQVATAIANPDPCVCDWLKNDTAQQAAITAKSAAARAYLNSLGLIDSQLVQIVS